VRADEPTEVTTRTPRHAPLTIPADHRHAPGHDRKRPRPFLHAAFLLLLCGSYLAGQATAAPPPPADDPAQLRAANAALSERVEALEAQLAIATKLDAQASRLAGLAERLEDRLAQEGAAPPTAGDAAAATRVGSLEQQLDTLAQRLHGAEERAAAAEAEVAELRARLKQQQLAVDEARLRADKAEKLHAALEESHARVRTENERLALKLATAKERQAEAMQRVVELDGRLAASAARAGVGVDNGGASGAVEAISDSPSAARPAPVDGAGGPVVYEVRGDDTLSKIAAKVYGDASAWRRIFDANRDVLNSHHIRLRVGRCPTPSRRDSAAR
jgi:nucleoid-associated protein YgaU